MGKWGGRRPGSGRKPKADVVRAVDGTRDRRPGKLLTHPSVPAAAGVVDGFDAPDDLTQPERAVWLEQAPHAFAARTLTQGTALSFRRYCRLVVQEQELSLASSTRGGSDHRGMIQRVNAMELQFGLTPCGKALYEAEVKPANPLDRFIKKHG